jgi:hypothetical protein
MQMAELSIDLSLSVSPLTNPAGRQQLSAKPRIAIAKGCYIIMTMSHKYLGDAVAF